MTDWEIDRILEMSTWSVDPNEVKGIGYEGGRGVLFEREQATERGGISLNALLISGIGYRKIECIGALGIIDEDAKFSPPSKENFMNRVTGTKMATGYAENGKIVYVKPEYRAMGTYLHHELKETVKKTAEVSKINLEKMVVPTVEAYGEYLNKELSDEYGNFGFVVFPVPSIEKPRVSEEIKNNLFKQDFTPTTTEDWLEKYHYLASPIILSFAEGLKELHDKGYAHLQTHLSNLYKVNNIPYVVDWATMRRLDGNNRDNAINRGIDLKRPVYDYGTLLSTLFSSPCGKLKLEIAYLLKQTTDLMYTDMFKSMMKTYSGSSKEIRLENLGGNAGKLFNEGADAFDILTKWIEEKILNKNGSPDKSKKIGRNEPCSCGSGKKYKKCCIDR